MPTPQQTITQHIQQFGWHCLHVHPVKTEQLGFSYSIGFIETFKSPEIMLFGATPDKAHALLSECAYLLKSGHQFLPDVEDSEVLAGGYKVIFKNINQKYICEYLGTATRHYQKNDIQAMIMFLPDASHLFPWHKGYDYIDQSEGLRLI